MIKLQDIQIYLIDINSEMITIWKRFFKNIPNVNICNIDLHTFLNQNSNIEAIVSPANSFGLMDGGYDKAIVDYYGLSVVQNVKQYILQNYFGEQPVGTAFTVPINETQYLIHSPTMRLPEIIGDSRVIYSCMRSTLIECMKNNIKSVVIPAFGGCTGQVDKRELANMMRLAYEQLINPPTEIAWNTPLRFEDYEIVQWSHAEGYPIISKDNSTKFTISNNLKSVIYRLEDTDSHTSA